VAAESPTKRALFLSHSPKPAKRDREERGEKEERRGERKRGERKKEERGRERKEKIFRGITFLMTGLKSLQDYQRKEKREEEEEKGEEEEEEEDTILVDYGYLCDVVKKNGGRILDDLPQRTLSSLHRKSPHDICEKGELPPLLLISLDHSRTLKYQLAIASCTPCLHYSWILNSTKQNKIITNLKPYLLPAGLDKQNSPIPQCLSFSFASSPLSFPSHSFPSSLFEGVRFELVGPPEFQHHWASVVREMGAVVVRRIFTAHEKRIDYVIFDENPPPAILKKALSLELPVATSEWLYQCLIHNEPLPFEEEEDTTTVVERSITF